jgi:hypothetical protein
MTQAPIAFHCQAKGLAYFSGLPAISGAAIVAMEVIKASTIR